MRDQDEARGYENFRGIVDEVASNSTPWYPARVRAPEGSPNVVVVLIDDLGFSDLGPFGSEIPTPHIDGVARRGLTFTNYHTAPVCSPARASLMTGLNPHRAGFGTVAHVDPGYPGFSCELPATAATLAESLRAGGYATLMVGKWHLTGESQMHDAGDRSSWPIQRGFDRYYGCMDGFTSMHHPHRLVRDNSVVERDGFEPDYYLTDDLTREAVAMIDELRANDTAKPFFLYFAHAAVHGPLQAKAADIAAHRGRYEAGWDAIRRERFARQQDLGIVPGSTVLSGGDLPGDADIPSWEELSPEDRELCARHMEVYAATVTAVDESVGTLVARLRELGELENTIIVIASDNGGTAEGGPNGTRSYFSQFVAGLPLPADWVRDVPRELELIGGPRVHSHYPSGWARASNTPFRSFKGSLYEGGVHAPLIVSWPGRADQNGETGVRSQRVFVSDLTPTILELTGVPPLQTRHGYPALSFDGSSFAAALDDPAAPGRALQYFECFGSRSLVSQGMKAIAPAPPAATEGAAGGTWELYDLDGDAGETRDLAEAQPELVQELAETWRREAWRNTVFPLNDDGSLFATRPETELALSEPVVVPPFRPPLERFRASRLTVLRSFEIQISVDTRTDTAGVIVAHGDQGGGYLVAVEMGRLSLTYNAYGEMHRAHSGVLEPGSHQIVVEFTELPELRWRVRLRVLGGDTAEIPAVPMLLGMAPFTGISVGYDYGGPVDWELYERHGSFRFEGGTLHRVRYVPGERSRYDHTVIRRIDQAVLAIAD